MCYFSNVDNTVAKHEMNMMLRVTEVEIKCAVAIRKAKPGLALP